MRGSKNNSTRQVGVSIFIYFMASSINQIALCDWLPERARWSYLPRSGLTTVSREKKIPREPNNKPFVDQAFSVRMAGYWSRFFYEFTDRDGVEVHKHAKKKRIWPISSHLDGKSLVNNPYICCIFVHPGATVCWNCGEVYSP